MRRIITWSVRGRHPWIVIAIWIVIAGALSMGPKLQSVTTNDASKGLSDKVESKRADALQQAEFSDAKGTPVIVVYSSDAPLTAADKAAVEAGKDWLLSGEEPVNSASVQYSEDGKGALVFASLDGNPGDEAFRDSIQQIRDHFGDTVEGMEVRVTGPGGLITDVYKIFLNADIKLLVGTVILVLVLLLVIYRSPVLPFVPLIAVGFGYFVSGGILALLANAFDVTLSGQATSLMVILLFGAGTDYGLLLISRYREDLRRETDARVALATALGETWEAIAASGLTVTLAVLTLLFAQYGDYRSFAPVLGLGVFVTLIAGLTLMPALLAVLGRRAFWPRVPKLGDATSHRTWERVAEWVAAGPRRAAGIVAAILVVLALGCLFYSPRFSFTDDFLTSMPSSEGYTLLEKHFPKGALAPTTVLIKAPEAPPEFVTGMITGALEQEPGRGRGLPHRHGHGRQAPQLPGDLRGRPVFERGARAGTRAAHHGAQGGRRRRGHRPRRRPDGHPGRHLGAEQPRHARRGRRRPARGRRDPHDPPARRRRARLPAPHQRALVPRGAGGDDRHHREDPRLGPHQLPHPAVHVHLPRGAGERLQHLHHHAHPQRGDGERAARRHGEGAVGHGRRADQRRHHPRRHVPDPALAAGQGPRRDQHRRGARRAHRHVPGAHRAGAGAHAVGRARRPAGRGRCGRGRARPRRSRRTSRGRSRWAASRSETKASGKDSGHQAPQPAPGVSCAAPGRG